MGILESLAKRRSYYMLNKNLPVEKELIIKTIEQAVELVPDAFNMKSARVAVLFDSQHDRLWDTIYESFGGKVSLEKISGFKAAAGTVLYFYDFNVVSTLQKKFPLYADNFPIWANQSNGMLQLAVWSALRELQIGASLQHYNPVIDLPVKSSLNLPESYILLAQMPFGGIAAEPESKPIEIDISSRVMIVD
ncbi:MAG: nitroreductase family protein [Candidatus Bruticola sp.]